MRVQVLVSSQDEIDADRHDSQIFSSCSQNEVGCRTGVSNVLNEWYHMRHSYSLASLDPETNASRLGRVADAALTLRERARWLDRERVAIPAQLMNTRDERQTKARPLTVGELLSIRGRFLANRRLPGLVVDDLHQVMVAEYFCRSLSSSDKVSSSSASSTSEVSTSLPSFSTAEVRRTVGRAVEARTRDLQDGRLRPTLWALTMAERSSRVSPRYKASRFSFSIRVFLLSLVARRTP